MLRLGVRHIDTAYSGQSAGLRPVSGTDFLVHNTENVLPQLPPLPKLQTMLSEEQLKSLHYDRRTFGELL